MRKWFVTVVVFCLAALVCAPVVLVLFGSLKSGNELADSLRPVLSGAEGSGGIQWTLLPCYPTISHFSKLLFRMPEFFTVFWNSVKIVALVIAGQLLVAVPAAWAFAVYRFRGRGILFTLYVMLMLLPFQVTMLPSYLVMNGMHLMDTQASVILPAVFSTFPVFLIYRGFTSVPKEMLEAARVDGAGEFRIFWKVGIPLGSPGILSAIILGFLDAWNMMEQPLAFLKDKTRWPLSLYLPEIGPEQAGTALAASVVTLVPAVFVFAAGQDYLEKGIVAAGVKG